MIVRLRERLTILGVLVLLVASMRVHAQADPLPSWNDGAAKKAIGPSSSRPRLGRPEVAAPRNASRHSTRTARYGSSTGLSAADVLPGAVPALVKAKPALASVEPFKTVMSGNRAAIAKLSKQDLEKILAATLTGMSTDEFQAQVGAWIKQAEHPRWKRPYTDLTYAPMQEVLKYLRANGYKTYIVTGGGQEFVRVYSDKVYGIPPEQVVGTAGGVDFVYGKDGKPMLQKVPKLLLNDDSAGKPAGIHLVIGRRPHMAVGNSVGDRQMLEYTGAGDGARLMMLVLHDDAQREFAYGPATGLPASKVGTFSQALYDEAGKNGWVVISMKNDWKRVFAFDP